MTATATPKLTGAAKRAAGAAASKAAEAAIPDLAVRKAEAKAAIAGATSIDGLKAALEAGVVLADEINAVTEAEAHAAEDAASADLAAMDAEVAAAEQARQDARVAHLRDPQRIGDAISGKTPKPAKAKAKAKAKKPAAKPARTQQYLVARQAQWSIAWLASHPGKMTADQISAAVGRDCAEGLAKLVAGDLITAWVPADGIKLYSIG